MSPAGNGTAILGGHQSHAKLHRKNNGFLFLVISGYLKNSHKNPKLILAKWESPNQGIPNQVPWLELFQIWDFCWYSLNILKYPKMGIRYFFLCYCRAKAVLSFLSHVKTLSVGLVPGIEPATSRSAVRDSLIPTELILCCGLVIQFILFQREVQCEFGEMDQTRWVTVYCVLCRAIFMILERLSFWNESILVLFTR